MKTSERWSTLALGFLLALLVTASACSPADTETAEPGEEAEPTEAVAQGSAQTTDWVGGVTLGTDLGDDETVPAEAATDRIPVGEIAFVSVAVDEPPAGAELRVTFVGPDGEVVAEDGKRVSPDAGAVFVSSGPTDEWAVGSYRVEVWIGDETVAEGSFELVAGG